MQVDIRYSADNRDGDYCAVIVAVFESHLWNGCTNETPAVGRDLLRSEMRGGLPIANLTFIVLQRPDIRRSLAQFTWLPTGRRYPCHASAGILRKKNRVLYRSTGTRGSATQGSWSHVDLQLSVAFAGCGPPRGTRSGFAIVAREGQKDDGARPTWTECWEEPFGRRARNGPSPRVLRFNSNIAVARHSTPCRRHQVPSRDGR